MTVMNCSAAEKNAQQYAVGMMQRFARTENCRAGSYAMQSFMNIVLSLGAMMMASFIISRITIVGLIQLTLICLTGRIHLRKELNIHTPMRGITA